MQLTLIALLESLTEGGSAAAEALLAQAAARPLRLSDRAILGALGSALRAHADVLATEPERLPSLAYPFLMATSPPSGAIETFYGELPLPGLRLRNPVVLPGGRVLQGIEAPVSSLDVCEGRVAAAMGKHGARVWSEDGVEIASLAAPGSDLTPITWADPEHLLIGTSGGSVHLWRIGAQTAETLPGTGRLPVRSVAGSEHRLVSTADDGQTRVWDRAGGPPLLLSGQMGRILCCCLRGDQVATGSTTGEVVVWDLSPRGQHLQFIAHEGAVNALALHPDGDTLLSVGEDGQLAGWQVSEGTPAFPGAEIGSAGLALGISPDGQHALTGNADHTVTLWGLFPLQALGVYLGHRRPVTGARWGADPHRVWTSGQDRAVRAWGPGELRSPDMTPHHTAAVRAVAFSPQGDRVSTGGRDGGVTTWSTETGALLHKVQEAESALYDLCYSPSGKLLLSVCTQGTGRVWDASTHELVSLLKASTDPATCCAFVDEERVLIGGRDKLLRLWGVQEGLVIEVFEGHTEWVRCCAVRPGEEQALTGSYDGSLRLWDLTTGETLQRLDHHTKPVIDCAISPSGHTAASLDLAGVLALWDLRDGRLLRAIEAHSAPGAGLAMPTETELLSVGQDRWLRAWSVDTGELRHALPLTEVLDSVAAAPGLIGVGDRAGNLWLFEDSRPLL